MALNYYLLENLLTSEPGDYRAVVQPLTTANFDDLVERIMERGTTLTKEDILGVLTSLQNTIITLLKEGQNINLPFANYSMSIKGVFNGQTDRFDPMRHQISCNINPGTAIMELVQSGIPVSKQDKVVPRPDLFEYTDYNSGERNSIVTPGGMGEIIGNNLKFEKSNPDEGLYFVSIDGTSIKVNIVGRITNTIIGFFIPETLVSGNYELVVKRAFGEEIRTGTLAKSLTVS